jgi:hypothetical protein
MFPYNQPQYSTPNTIWQTGQQALPKKRRSPDVLVYERLAPEQRFIFASGLQLI